MGDFFDLKLLFEFMPLIFARVHITLLIVISAVLIGLILGTALALVRIYKIAVLKELAVLYISFMRGTPIIVQLFVVYYGAPAVLMKIGININRWDAIYFVILTYGLNSAAFLSEIIKSAVSSVSVGQSEAAYSVGMTKFQTFRRIIVPQALSAAIPNFGTTVSSLLQESSLAFSLGIIDIMGKVQSLGKSTYHTLEGYIDAAILFLILGIILEKLFNKLEKRYSFKKAVSER